MNLIKCNSANHNYSVQAVVYKGSPTGEIRGVRPGDVLPWVVINVSLLEIFWKAAPIVQSGVSNFVKVTLVLSGV